MLTNFLNLKIQSIILICLFYYFSVLILFHITLKKIDPLIQINHFYGLSLKSCYYFIQYLIGLFYLFGQTTKRNDLNKIFEPWTLLPILFFIFKLTFFYFKVCTVLFFNLKSINYCGQSFHSKGRKILSILKKSVFKLIGEFFIYIFLHNFQLIQIQTV